MRGTRSSGCPVSRPSAARRPGLAWLRGLAVIVGAGLTVGASEPLTGSYYAHDPSTLIRDGNRYYFFRTDYGIGINWSTDLHQWNGGGRVFPSGPPSWTTNAVPAFEGHFWAPDIAYFNGRYHLYYSISEWGTIDSAIGLVTTPSLSSPTWSDQGMVMQSDAGATSYNCIDPGLLLETNGSVWMSFGSYSDGIFVAPIDPATGKRLNPAQAPTKIADNGPAFFSNTTEASYLYRRGAYYYLFLNFGGCCQGTNSTYNIRVGRSANVTGPYLDRNGVSLLNGGGTLLLATTGRYIGPGHAGVFSEKGTDWMSYHYYDGEEGGSAKLGLLRLQWSSDGWPDVLDDSDRIAAFYPFEIDARDHLGLHSGELIGGAAVVPETDRGSVLQLDGNTGHVLLPEMVARGRTFAAWVHWNGGADWQRIFDFGDGVIGGNTGRYLFLTPRAFGGRLRFAITTAGSLHEQIIDAPAALPTNAWVHVAVTVDPPTGLLYVNGEPVGTNHTMTLGPWEVQARSNYVGRSQWPDPLFNGRIDSFRVYGRPLAPEQIRDLAFAHPALAHRYSFDAAAEDSFGFADGLLEGNALVTNGVLVLAGVPGDYVEMPGGLVSGCAAVTLEFWAGFGTNASSARVFDFGETGTRQTGLNYLSFSPNSGLGSQRLSMVTSGGTYHHDVTGAWDGLTLHVACVVDPAAGYTAIYTNGVLAGEQTGSVPPLSSVSSALAYLGRSLFAAHPWFNGTIDEFRIYDGRLRPGEIAANHRAGPDGLALPITLDRSAGLSGVLEFAWPDYALGFVLQSSGALGPGPFWTPVSSEVFLQDGVHRTTISTSTTNQYFRLKR